MIRQVKRYGQHCPLARALDVVGERWSMLIVRELTLGPRRYSDLQAGLPGIPTNLLANRLKELQGAGIISKSTLPPPTVVTVYELTEAGQALRPALTALRNWSRQYGSPAEQSDEVRPAWALLSAADRPTTMADGKVCELNVDGELFSLTAKDSRLLVHSGPSAKAASIALSARDLYRYMSGKSMEIPTITGDAKTARAALHTLHGVLVNP
jgi:DNA-binding HxlR family transcriptional regulator